MKKILLISITLLMAGLLLACGNSAKENFEDDGGYSWAENDTQSNNANDNSDNLNTNPPTSDPVPLADFMVNTSDATSGGVVVYDASMGEEEHDGLLIFHRGGSVAQLASDLPPWSEGFDAGGNTIVRYAEFDLGSDFTQLSGTFGRVNRRENYRRATGTYLHDTGSAIIRFYGDGELLEEMIMEDITEERVATVNDPDLVTTFPFSVDVTNVEQLNIIVYIRRVGMQWGNIVRLEVGMAGYLQ